MFNFSGSELVFLLLLALIILGPEKLPEAIRKFGQTYAEFKKVSTGFQTELKQALDEPVREMRQTAELFKQAATFDVLDPQQTVVPAPQQQTQQTQQTQQHPATVDADASAGAAPPLAAAAVADTVSDAPAASTTEAPKQVTGETVQRMRSLDDVIVRQPFGQAMSTPAPAAAPASTDGSPTDAAATDAPATDAAATEAPASGEVAAPAPEPAREPGEGTTPA